MHTMVGCEQVIGELSPYLERAFARVATVDRGTPRRLRMCAAVCNGVRNVLILATDNPEIICLPQGFGERLYSLLKEQRMS
jgi:hypothetical protein